jgi:membrane-bound lytic murein transglycosylase D
MKVAEAAKRVHMSEADFRAVNNIPPRMQIKAGSALLVPRTSNVIEDVAARVADNGQLGLSPEAAAKRKGSKGGKGKLAGKHGGKSDTKQAGKNKKSKADVRLAKK